MNRKKLAALLLAAVTGCGAFTGCSKKIAVDNGSEESATEAETTIMNPDSYQDIVMSDIDSAEESTEPLTYAELGEFVTPNAEDIDSDLGSYREATDGVKLYFNDDEFPKELLLTLDQYFTAFANNDYTLYTRCVYPDYLEKMNAYLEKEYQYDMKHSFATQCTNLATTANGPFKVTRIKMNVPKQYVEGEDNLEAYFKNFTDILGEGYYEQLKKDADKIYDGEFYLMAEDRMGNEQVLISAYEIICVEKDGRYYVFG